HAVPQLLLERLVWLRVETQRLEISRARHRDRAQRTAVNDRADRSARPERTAVAAAEERHGREAESVEQRARSGAARGELAASRGRRERDDRALLGPHLALLVERDDVAQDVFAETLGE